MHKCTAVLRRVEHGVIDQDKCHRVRVVTQEILYRLDRYVCLRFMGKHGTHVEDVDAFTADGPEELLHPDYVRIDQSRLWIRRGRHLHFVEV